jgi:amino acid adenylation domain-containing protein
VNAHELLAAVANLGVEVRADGEKLVLRGRREALTPDVIERLKAMKPQLLAELSDPNGGQPFALSSAQLPIWNACSANPDSPAYNINAVLELAPDYDHALLQRALGLVLERHPALRCRYRADADGLPRQTASSHCDTLIPRQRAAAETLDATLDAQIDRPFRLDREQPLRLGIYEVEGRAPVALLVAHHIAADFSSIGVLVQELQQAYAALVAGQPFTPAALELSPVEYVERERRAARPEEGDEAYFRELLEDEDLTLDLPADQRRRAGARRGADFNLALDADLARRVRAYAQQAGATPYAVMLGAYGLLLSRLARKQDFRIGLPTEGRWMAGTEQLIGNFVNLVPFRARLTGAASFNDCVAATRRELNAALSRERIPFDELVRRHGRRRDALRAPFFDVLFNWNKLRAGEIGTDRLVRRHVRGSSTGRSGATHELALSVVEQGEQLSCLWTYDAGRFGAALIESFAQAYRQLLASALAAPDAALECHALLTPAQAIASLDGARGAPGATEFIPALRRFERHARDNGDAIALSVAGTDVSYRQLNQRANVLARHLLQLGAAREQVIAIQLERSVDFFVSCLAVGKTGAAWLPLDVKLPLDRVEYVCRETKALALLTTTRARELPQTRDISVEFVDLFDAGSEDPGDLTDIALLPQQLVYVVYTSGSTGRPKGVMISQEGLSHFLSWHVAFFDHARPVTTQCASPGFDACVLEMWPTLAAGGRLCVVPDAMIQEPRLLPVFMGQQGVTFSFLSTPLFEAVPPADWAKARSLRQLTAGGEAMRSPPPPGDVQMYNYYGPTEISVMTSFGPVARGAEGLPDLGRPIANSIISVRDTALNVLAPGMAGELLLGGTGVARGYLGDARRTAEMFVPDAQGSEPGARIYRSGDLGRYDAHGRLHYLGRADRQLKIRGFRIEPGEIEQVLREHDGVVDARIVVAGDDNHRHLVAFCAGSATAEELLAFLQRRLPPALVPAAIDVRETLPLNNSGKVDIPQLLASHVQQRREQVVEAATDTEVLLLAAWRDVLDRQDVGVDDDFFAVGGHSLLAAQLVARIRTLTAREVPIATLLECSSVRRLAAHIDAGQVAAAAADEGGTLAADHSRRHDPFPLTDVQYAYWAGRASSLEMGNTATHVYTEGTYAVLDVAEVERIWNVLIARHDMLRAVFSIDGQQRVLEQVPSYRIEVEDLRALDEDGKHAALMQIRERMSHQVFDPQRWPLFEIRASRIADDRIRLHTGIDALIADARSFSLLEHEYDLIEKGRGNELRPLEISFRDYVLAERALRESPVYDSARAYWLARAADFPAAPQLPLAMDPSRIQAPKFQRHQARLDAARWAALKQRARALRVTPSAVLLTAYADVLAQYSAEPRFALNLTLFNRAPLHPDVEFLIGDFTSLSLLEVSRAEATPFVERVQRCQAQLWSDLEHRAFSGIEMLRELNRASNRRTAMPVVFTSVLPLDQSDSGPVGAASPTDYAISQTSQVWMDHVVQEDRDELAYNWDVVEALFPAGMVETMFQAYSALVQALADGDAAWQAQALPALPAAQLQARADYNATALPLPQGRLFEPFLAQAERTPQAIAVYDGEREISYAELRTLAFATAEELRAAGVQRGDRVAVLMHKGWEQVVAVLAIQFCAAAYLPIDANLPAARQAQLLQQGGVRVAVAQAHTNIEVEVSTVRVAPGLRAAEETIVPGADTDLAYVIFTSGSTGVPKGVMIDHRGALNTIVDCNRRFGVTAADRVLALSSLSFDLSVYDIFGLLAAGGAIVIPPDGDMRDPEHWAPWIARHGVTIFNAVPSFAQMLADLARTREELQQLPSLRLFMMSGDWIPMALAPALRQLYPQCRLTSLGGATEASIWSICHDITPADDARRSIPYGRPMDNQRFHVLRADFSPSPDWVPGMLYIGGDGLALGYYGDEAKTAASFITHPHTGERLYRTGDLGRLLPDGFIEFLGRADNQVKISGHRIELGEIETHLAAHAAVQEAVVDVRGEGAGRSLCAYVVPVRDLAAQLPGLAAGEDARTTLLADLDRHLRARLPAYMAPRHYVLLDSLPLNVNGKVDRRALPAPDAQASVARRYEAPANALEQQIAELWQQMLGLPRVGRHDNFFELGGNSVLIVQMHAQLAGQVQTSFSIADLFAHVTVAEMARHLSGQDSGGALLADSAERASRQRSALGRRRSAAGVE